MGAHTKNKPIDQRRAFPIVVTWTDSPPQFLGVFNGTLAEAKAYCAGWTAGIRADSLELYNGTASLVDEVLADLTGNGLDSEAMHLEGGA